MGRIDFLDMYRQKGFVGDLLEYGAQVSAVDASVGRIMKALQESGLADNTMVILASDQGSYFPNLPLRGTKAVGTTLYEGGQKIPFIVKWPGVTRPGERIESLVQTTDIFPTLCEIVGEDPGRYEGLEGLSLFGLLTRGEPLDREAIFAFRSYDGQYASVLDADHWKLIAYRDGRQELYKVDEDISESKNLSGSNPEKATELSARLSIWLQNTGIFFEDP